MKTMDAWPLAFSCQTRGLCHLPRALRLRRKARQLWHLWGPICPCAVALGTHSHGIQTDAWTAPTAGLALHVDSLFGPSL